jgi:23S rRNA (guanine2445-N2)-methyltransferase / 23S rRNA (guanine2069-N7)-methyltransferase
MSIMRFFGTAPKGIAPVLVDELRALGASGVAESRAGVSFEGSLELAYRACLWSRTANRILMPLAEFRAPTPEALYDGVRAIRWSEHLDASGTLAVDFNASLSRITHTHYGALKVKDAIVDQFRDSVGVRPSVDLRRPDIRINVYVHRNQAALSLDLAGDSLHRRGYRGEGVAAPLKENLAAAILLRAGWSEIAKAGGSLVDPMCGSGTLPIEAAWIAADIAPGLMREYFGFLKWKGHDADLWERLADEARQRRERGVAGLPAIVGFDANRDAVRVALSNVDMAGLRGRIHIERRELAKLEPPRGARTGLVVVNPPYGERIGDLKALAPLYASLGDILKQRFQGWRAAVFTGNPDLAKGIGLRARRIHKLYNGAIECRLLHFDVQPSWFSTHHEDRGATPPKPTAPEDLGPGAQMFANRLRKNLKELRRWAERERISCYRVYDADMPEYALAIDVYEGEHRWVHAQEYEAPKTIDPAKAESRLREALAMIPEVMDIPPAQLFLKVRRRQKGSAQYEKLSQEQKFCQVREADCTFLVNFTDYLDTGLFLDHRLTRRLIREHAKGRRFLNLFAYTGTATVYAAKGGASCTTTVDMSNTYLAWARRNLALNGYSGREHEFVQADCLEWPHDQAAHKWGKRYGLIFLDPPTFSSSKRMQKTFDVQRDHVPLIRDTVALLEPGGVLIFSNNYRKFKMDFDQLPGLHIEDVTQATIPKDFARNPRIHNCWKITRAT